MAYIERVITPIIKNMFAREFSCFVNGICIMK